VIIVDIGFMSVLELELLDVDSHSVFLRWKNYAPDSRLLSWVVSYRKTYVFYSQMYFQL